MNPKSQSGSLLLEMIIVIMLILILIPAVLGSAKSLNAYQCKQAADKIESFLESARIRAEPQKRETIIEIKNNILIEKSHKLTIPDRMTINYTSNKKIKFKPGGSVEGATIELNCNNQSIKISVNVRPGSITIK